MWCFLVISFNNLFASLCSLTLGFCFTVAVVASWAACMGSTRAARQRTCMASACLIFLHVRLPCFRFNLFTCAEFLLRLPRLVNIFFIKVVITDAFLCRCGGMGFVDAASIILLRYPPGSPLEGTLKSSICNAKHVKLFSRRSRQNFLGLYTVHEAFNATEHAHDVPFRLTSRKR